jgi:beta-1,4-mannosyltransferase
MRVVHLPVYHDNPYQRLLMDAQRKLGLDVIEGGGGGNFFRTALRRWRADILHFHWLHPYMIRRSAVGTALRSMRLLAELQILKAGGQRVIWTVHNLKNHDNRHVGLERLFTKQFSKLASAIITHTESARQRVKTTFEISNPGIIQVVPHGSYIGYYPNEISKAAAREQLGLSSDSVVFLFVGRIERYKELPALIREFKTVPKHLKLVIAGRPADMQIQEDIEKAIDGAQNIALQPRFVADDQIQVYMNACDVVVLPYADVLTSGAAILAMSFARACVAPEVDGTHEMLDSRGTITYNPSQPGALAHAIGDASLDKARLMEMGSYNLDKISSYHWDEVARRTVEIYDCVS